MLGLVLQAETLRDGLKLVSIWLLALLAGATVSQLIARNARQGGLIKGGSVKGGSVK